MESAINQVHPDTAADDADAFFGGDPAEQAASEPQSEPESPPAPDAPEDASEPTTDGTEPPAASDVAQRGAVEREYIVFQQLELNAETLRALLAEVEKGTAGKIRLALIELHRVVARNDKQAVGQTYERHQQTLGAVCDLAAVSSRALKHRHIEPEEIPVERKLRIT